MKKSNNLWIVLILTTFIFASCTKETNVEPQAEADAIEQLAIDMITFFPKENTPEQNDLIVQDVNERYVALEEEELMQYFTYKRDAQIRNSKNFDEPELQITYAHESYENNKRLNEILKEKLGKALNKVTREEYKSLDFEGFDGDTETDEYTENTEAAEDRSACQNYNFWRKIRLINYNYGSAGGAELHTNIGDNNGNDCDDQLVRWYWAFNTIFCLNVDAYNWIEDNASVTTENYGGSSYRVAAANRQCNHDTKLFLPIGWRDTQHTGSTLSGIFGATSQQNTTVSTAGSGAYHWGCD